MTSKLELSVEGPASFDSEAWMQAILDYVEGQKRLWNYEQSGKMHVYHRFSKESGRIESGRVEE